MTVTVTVSNLFVINSILNYVFAILISKKWNMP